MSSDLHRSQRHCVRFAPDSHNLSEDTHYLSEICRIILSSDVQCKFSIDYLYSHIQNSLPLSRLNPAFMVLQVRRHLFTCWL